jgi:uncharacterized membrane protein
LKLALNEKKRRRTHDDEDVVNDRIILDPAERPHQHQHNINLHTPLSCLRMNKAIIVIIMLAAASSSTTYQQAAATTTKGKFCV